MRTSLFFLLAASASQSVVGAPQAKTVARDSSWPYECTSLNQRKAWSALTDDEKAAYIEAELCLMSSPTQLDIEGALNRWDEVHYGHIVQSNVVHDTGSFLPWHRLYMRAHELLLQTECGYEGAQPYWDELADVTNLASVANASVFDVDTGFGSGAVDDDGCVTTGPFVNLTLHLSQYSSSDNYCLSRSLSQNGFNNAAQANVDTCYASANYSVAWQCYKAKVHGAGHAGVGGVMLDVSGSPGDPLFFLHHTYLDRIWWQWQQANLSSRLTDMEGRNVASDSYIAQNNFTYPTAAILDYNGDPGNVTTLNHTLWMVGLIPNATVGDVMDLGGEVICAEYID